MKPTVLLLLLPLSYGLTLAYQEWQLRQASITSVPTAPLPAAAAPQAVTLNTLAVATVFGLATQGSRLNSTEPLTLRAIVVANDSDSRALLDGPDGARFYRTGERLPGGSVLRRIETAQVVLWREGREESLNLHRAGTGRFLQLAQAQSPAATVHLRPTVEKTRSH